MMALIMWANLLLIGTFLELQVAVDGLSARHGIQEGLKRRGGRGVRPGLPVAVEDVPRVKPALDLPQGPRPGARCKGAGGRDGGMRRWPRRRRLGALFPPLPRLRGRGSLVATPNRCARSGP